MSDRFALRSLYIEGWYELDITKLLAATAKDFIFDDPREPLPVNRNSLGKYMHDWVHTTRVLGSTSDWTLANEVRQDNDGVLIDWEWWELDNTPLCGMAFVKTRDDGVFMEKITYFDRAVYSNR
jgi:hypothetical protein